MTPRKPQSPVALPPPSKLVPYPPASIWKTKEEGASFEFRGNSFARRGNLVTHLPTVAGNESGATKSHEDWSALRGVPEAPA
jgi:hypothetical protein